MRRGDAIYAIAAAWASIDGKLDEFVADKELSTKQSTGHYDGYLSDAQELLERIERRGFTVTSLPTTRQVA